MKEKGSMAVSWYYLSCDLLQISLFVSTLSSMAVLVKL